MKLSDIVPSLKEGDRFQKQSWYAEVKENTWYFKEGQEIYKHYSGGTVERASFYSVVHLSDDDWYILPPEPKFKVGDTASLPSLKKPLGEIDKREYHQHERKWAYRIPTCGWYSEDRITLYTGPDICDSCGQEVIKEMKFGAYPEWEVGEKDKEQVKQKEGPRFKIGDMVVAIDSERHIRQWDRGEMFTIDSKRCGVGTDMHYTCNFVSKKGHQYIEEHRLEPYVEPPIEWDGGDLPKWKALFLTWKMWDWLAENPERSKRSWPEWTYNEGQVSGTDSECFACEYFRRGNEASGDCGRFCIMQELWPRGCQADLSDSPFRYWEKNYGSKSRVHHAQTIADFAKKKYYEEIEKNSA